jgi:hypothetical protein
VPAELGGEWAVWWITGAFVALLVVAAVAGFALWYSGDQEEF